MVPDIHVFGITLNGQDKMYLFVIYNHFQQWEHFTLQLEHRSRSKQLHQLQGGRERTSPDSLIKSLNFVSCSVWRNFINFVKNRFWQILNWLGLLVNSANVIPSFYGSAPLVLASMHIGRSAQADRHTHIHASYILTYIFIHRHKHDAQTDSRKRHCDSVIANPNLFCVHQMITRLTVKKKIPLYILHSSLMSIKMRH